MACKAIARARNAGGAARVPPAGQARASLGRGLRSASPAGRRGCWRAACPLWGSCGSQGTWGDAPGCCPAVACGRHNRVGRMALHANVPAKEGGVAAEGGLRNAQAGMRAAALVHSGVCRDACACVSPAAWCCCPPRRSWWEVQRSPGQGVGVCFQKKLGRPPLGSGASARSGDPRRAGQPHRRRIEPPPSPRPDADDDGSWPSWQRTKRRAEGPAARVGRVRGCGERPCTRTLGVYLPAPRDGVSAQASAERRRPLGCTRAWRLLTRAERRWMAARPAPRVPGGYLPVVWMPARAHETSTLLLWWWWWWC